MRHSTAALLLACLLAAATAAAADDSNTKADPAHWGKPWDPPGGGSYSSNMYVAKLRGDGTRASAHMTLVVDEAAGTASYSLMMYNVNGYIMSHIHVGAAGVNGPPAVLLLPGLKPNTSNVIVSGADLPTIAPTDICAMTYTATITAADMIQFASGTFTWADFMTNLASGTLYANIHTAEAPAGLIRGQLLATKGWKKNVAVSCAVGKGWKYGKP